MLSCFFFCISEEIELVITQHEHLMVSVYSVRFGQSVNIPSNICGKKKKKKKKTYVQAKVARLTLP